MYPLPVVGAQMGVWPMWSVVLGFTGIALILISMIVLYPIAILRIIFFDKKYEELELSPRTLQDPGMLGMLMAVLILIITGLPLLTVATAVLLYLYGILPMAWITWAAEPVVFQFVFYIFAHNLMESMAIMIVSAVYGTLPLYLADGTRKLYSDKLANAALWILLITSVTSFFHHFYTMFPALPSTFSYHGNVMSWGTGLGGAFTIFTILATIWKHGIRPEPGVMMILGGFIIYCLDGVTAMVVANVALSYHLHGTMWVGGHAMTVLLSMSMMWMGVLYHHYPVITNRNPDGDSCRRSYRFYFIGGVGLMYSFMAGGASGMPRRIADWVQSGFMTIGFSILIFGIILTLGFVFFLSNLSKSSEIKV
jgi:cytochrome c oxidase subunit 1